MKWRNGETAQSITENLAQACLNSHSVRGYEVFKISNGMTKKKVEMYTQKKCKCFSRKTLKIFH